MPEPFQKPGFNVQHEIASNLIADVGYYGQHGVHLVGQEDINEVAPGKALAAGIALPLKSADAPLLNSLRPYLGYGPISLFAPSFGLNYNSLQTLHCWV